MLGNSNLTNSSGSSKAEAPKFSPSAVGAVTGAVTGASIGMFYNSSGLYA